MKHSYSNIIRDYTILFGAKQDVANHHAINVVSFICRGLLLHIVKTNALIVSFHSDCQLLSSLRGHLNQRISTWLLYYSFLCTALTRINSNIFSRCMVVCHIVHVHWGDTSIAFGGHFILFFLSLINTMEAPTISILSDGSIFLIDVVQLALLAFSPFTFL